MKKMIYVGVMVLMMVFGLGTGLAEEAKPSNQSAIETGNTAQDPATTIEQETGSAIKIAGNKVPKNQLCESQRDKCCTPSPKLTESACRNFFSKCDCN